MIPLSPCYYSHVFLIPGNAPRDSGCGPPQPSRLSLRRLWAWPGHSTRMQMGLLVPRLALFPLWLCEEGSNCPRGSPSVAPNPHMLELKILISLPPHLPLAHLSNKPKVWMEISLCFSPSGKLRPSSPSGLTAEGKVPATCRGCSQLTAFHGVKIHHPQMQESGPTKEQITL